MISKQIVHQFKQAIAFMLGCTIPGTSWTPSLSLVAIRSNERGYNDGKVRVFERRSM